MKDQFAIVVMSGALAACVPVSAPQLRAQEQAGQATRCISLQQVAGRRVLADGSVLFESLGPVDYRNRLASQCPGVNRISRSAVISIVTASPGNQLCRGDRIRVTGLGETSVTGMLDAPSCILADFDPVARR